MPHPSVAVADDEPTAVAASRPERPKRPEPAEPAPAGGLTVEVDEAGVCAVRLRGPFDDAAITRLEIVLKAVESMARPVLVDLTRARTRSRRLLRVVAAVAARRRAEDRDVILRGVHPDVVPDLGAASLPETFLVYAAVCR